jgi:hypothetical protein
MWLYGPIGSGVPGGVNVSTLAAIPKPAFPIFAGQSTLKDTRRQRAAIRCAQTFTTDANPQRR